MRYSLFFSLLTITLLMTSCAREKSADVNQDRIHTTYELFYNTDEDVTYARAWFRFGNANGTLLELTAPSQVTFEGETMTFNGVLAFYEKKYAGLKSSGTFKFEDTEGATYQNTIDVRPIAFGTLPDSIARNAAFSIPFTGGPVATNEVIGIWANGENEGDAQAAITFETGAGTVIVPADRMAKIGAGPGKIYMDRRFIPTITEAPGAGGIISGVYRAKTADVIFK
jgi:hypothetical protein